MSKCNICKGTKPTTNKCRIPGVKNCSTSAELPPNEAMATETGRKDMKCPMCKQKYPERGKCRLQGVTNCNWSDNFPPELPDVEVLEL